MVDFRDIVLECDNVHDVVLTELAHHKNHPKWLCEHSKQIQVVLIGLPVLVSNWNVVDLLS
jgi:hypothetical protein